MTREAESKRRLAGRLCVAAVAIFCAAAGCTDSLNAWPWAAAPTGAAPLPDDLPPVEPDAPYAGAATTRPAATRPAADVPGDATVDAYVRIALRRNPGIRAARRRIQRLRQRIPQETALPDPKAEVAPVGEMAETAAGQVHTMIGVRQTFPAPGKLSTRGRIAAREVAVAQQELRRTKLRTVAEVRRAYWSYYAAARAIEVTRDGRALLDDIRRIARAKYESGTAGQQDVLRATVAVGNVDRELARLRQQRRSAAAMLNRLMDRPTDAALPDPPPVDPRDLTVALEDLLTAAQHANPALQRLRERLRQQRLRRKLARLDYWPDVTVGAHYNVVDDEGLSAQANGDDQWWFSLGFNLPVWRGKLAAGEREAIARWYETAAALDDERSRVAFAVRDALIRAESDLRQAELLRDRVIPAAEAAIQAAAGGYQSGRDDFLTLLDNWRRRLEFERMYHAAVARLEQDYADLERAVGRPLPRERVDADGGDRVGASAAGAAAGATRPGGHGDE
ncbi:MAG: TolC family protein [Planctomycetota bacterium]